MATGPEAASGDNYGHSGRKRRLPGGLELGSLRRTTPISSSFGFDRGQPIDRYYIEDFLRRHGGAQG